MDLFFAARPSFNEKFQCPQRNYENKYLVILFFFPDLFVYHVVYVILVPTKGLTKSNGEITWLYCYLRALLS